MMNYKTFGAAALSVALAMTPALARDGSPGDRGGGVGMSRGASPGTSRNVAVGGQNRGAGNSSRGATQAMQGGQFTRGNRSARGGNFRGDRRGGFGVGVAAGVALGGYYGSGYGDDYYGYGDGGPYGQAYYGDDDGVPAYAYQEGGYSCAQRYRSFDPNTGTYLGYDGRRHPCM